MKLYTRRGDDGSTDLFGGQRVPKDALRVETYGTVDELNGALGLALAAGGSKEILDILREQQALLFVLGSQLACPSSADTDSAAPPAPAVPAITAAHVQRLEDLIDLVCQPLPPMRTFILPGGCELAARLHLARAICRRAERVGVSLSRHESVPPTALIFLNRLSDLLFALARRANQLQGIPDVPWVANPST
ncbi:MAG: cob(I)yrinic acid a,c-diamide adenosyltransferase [Phycisphaeraceae bacterium]|nr:cob(I)yrinic acid a,c-diamide adenosyltransferase [Phycisphaeraceae bacterium]